MKDQFALRIYDGKELIKVITTRSGLLLKGTEVENDLSDYAGKSFVLFNITKQKEVKKGTVKITKKIESVENETN